RSTRRPRPRRPIRVRRCPRIFCFPAEDGIRDRNVTGVQTCALPILEAIYSYGHQLDIDEDEKNIKPWQNIRDSEEYQSILDGERSEERRVGKEGGARGAADPETEQ